ncbi:MULTISPECIES: DUF6185 family protein [unclassified Streptomyces]|uniref:DUF6185 family protein n=1 Tax=unclassified Streptomyces TaxID=2593676 RepID=UPI002DDAF05E|nr:DUF6185 family protein [Streptomyces sp. NBC_01750]WSB05709.1 DUF6185 family protein [Streptomyces sp. NBC_01794]WSD37568.1 DUF6185 family protein [Streptomyces sp. NBC_01750]
MRLWLRVALVLLGISLGGALAPAHAAPADTDECAAAGLRTARVIARVTFTHDGENYTRADSRFTVRAPATWKWAPDLLLNGDTERYRTAMRCLLREPDTSLYRYNEQQTHPPEVSAEARWITVEQRTATVVYTQGDRDFGPWRLAVGKRLWTVELQVPTALRSAQWERVEARLGGRAARLVSPPPTEGSATQLVWLRGKPGSAPPEVRIRLQPPAVKALTTRWSDPPWTFLSQLGWVTWDAVFFVALVAVLLRFRQPAVPPHLLASLPPTAGPAEKAALRGLWLLALLLVVLVPVQWANVLNVGEHETAIQLSVSTLGGLALCAFGRPRRLAVGAVAMATVGITAVLVLPGLFGLQVSDLEGLQRFTARGGMYWSGAACACTVFIWLVGVAASGVRLWRSPFRPSAAPVSLGHFPLPLLGVLALLAAALPAAGAWAGHITWERASWLSARTTDVAYGERHLDSVFNYVNFFAAYWPEWVCDTVWKWGAGLAILAVLRARMSGTGASGIVPSPPERTALVLFYIVIVMPFIGWYAGVQLPVLTLTAGWLALCGLLALGRRRAVLERKLPPGVGSGAPLHEAVRESDRQHLMQAARRHRDLHAQLRRLEQGQQNGERRQLERALDRLQRWRPPQPATPHQRVRMPDGVGPVELALAWGPGTTWWENGCRASRYAAGLAVPATAVTTWANNIRGPLWSETYAQPYGVANLVTSTAASVIVWAGAGFILGALWRQLPGRRGPARAFGLWTVYTVPWLVDSIGVAALGQSHGTRALDLALTLLILTLTGIAMDIDTFRRERHYWPTRAGLLLSLYQLRTASVHIAFFVAQLVALVTIWQQLKGNTPTVVLETPRPPGGHGSTP